jgi:nucleotide-binding universal stress UspA family protein
MSWKEILVYAKRDSGQEAYAHIAAQLARRFGARVTGVFPLSEVALMRNALDRICDESAVRQYVREGYERAEVFETRFRQYMTERSVEFDWRTGEGDPAEIMVLAGRMADLVIIEQRRPDFDQSAWDVPEAIALNTGTPTLVVPHSRTFETVGKRVLLAWNGSRDAAHAIGSAMPMIDAADSVVLLSGMSKEQFLTVTRRPQMNVRRRLEGHCANVAVVDFLPGRGEEGAGILESARKYDCDVIVMGAYGHSRVRELLLGGATRDVLREMTCPVLFAH